MSAPQPHIQGHIPPLPDQSMAVPTSAEARVKCHIAVLEEQLETMKQERGTKQRFKELPESHSADYISFAHVLPWLHGADAAHGDDTSTLKDLIATWVNQEFSLTSLLRPDDKQSRGFAHNICGKLLCPSEWDWDNNLNNLEQGLLKLKVLVQAFKAVFTSPSFAKEVDGDSDGADILENNRCACW
ncbi:hypothetical protein EV702DRAFT_1053796 [Suillus placidus]|uniref:Uncharacterized protein n=1 Tax=Suillus placidus TaxID=48579 RepID=A0A9P6ZFE4_9AGAM|nr:hypothetical protein EV702DRAFT_1053796 [Suillus placidus]